MDKYILGDLVTNKYYTKVFNSTAHKLNKK